MVIESDRPTLLKLCWLIVQQQKAELAYSRAQWRVSYYRKLKAKQTSKKWSNLSKLTKQIEATRLIALKKQKDLLDAKTRLRNPIFIAALKINAGVKVKNGKVAEIILPRNSSRIWQVININQIAEMSDQHEANSILARVLSK